MAARGLGVFGGVFGGVFVAAVLFAMSTSSADEVALAKHEASTHPLAWTVRYANSRSEYIRENIRDYSCRLIKRERIDGKLQDYQFANVKVRCSQSDEDDAPPMSVFMHYLAPSNIKGRRVLYVEGKNRGRALVRKGGSAFKYVKLKIDPLGAAARRDSNYSITEIGFDKIIERLIEKVENDIRHDPKAVNTSVSHFKNAKVNKRLCTHIQVVHPKQSEGIEFHRASLYVDDELNIPIRLVVYGWPSSEDEKPPLLEEYTYIDLKLNVGLTDEDFSESKLGNGKASN